MDELEVPDRALEGVGMLACAVLPNAAEWVRAIATPVVVAELRRLAKEYDRARREGREMVLPSTALRRRAERLEAVLRSSA